MYPLVISGKYRCHRDVYKRQPVACAIAASVHSIANKFLAFSSALSLAPSSMPLSLIHIFGFLLQWRQYPERAYCFYLAL